MPVTIGAAPAADFTQPLGMLMDCHRRIERFLGALVQVAERAKGGEMNAMEKRDWLNALEYFRNAAPRHTADEEESLFPRLRNIGGRKVEAALDDVKRLQAEHVRADAVHAQVDEIGRRWIEQQSLSQEDTTRVRGALAELTRLYGPHLELEDRTLFPIAAEVLPRSDLSEMGAEMAHRRGLDKSR
ncbi:MAG: hemerythrin domain-containing protein, partial [Bryobacteraceae bacterium]